MLDRASSSTSDPEDRARADRFLRDSRSRRGSGWSWLGWIVVAVASFSLLVVLLRRRARAAAAQTIDAPSFSFRSKSYRPSRDADGTAVWSVSGAEGAARANAMQVKLAAVVFNVLEDCVRDAAVRLVRTHEVWFDGGAKSASDLARELKVSDVRVPPDVRDVTLYANHAAFSGHVVEIAVSRAGRVTFVGLLG